ncbi:MarR family winged helix-turn-helix transcriptional regulator [Brucella pseudogrignonensis]|uniref:MarR family winged helix-turn-helix transcriptional regulator n=1 Tax=Brucella pseudogrignonensis TaxID=419475 RepID=UPI001292C22A|nr:MarR family winged helix-turn-helix transcriptional regulator [Brucella pseudogrignonensis]
MVKKTASKVENSSPTNIDHVDIDVLENTLSFYIRIIDSSVSRDLDERLEKLEVAKGKGKITALFLIDSHPGIRPSVVAELAMKDRSAMGRILDLFEKQGLIERRTSQEDSRAHELYTTDKGAALAKKVRAIVTQQSEDFFKIIPENEQKILMDILKRAYVRLRDDRK